MQRILTLVLFVCGFASAAFLDIDIKDSRLQTENSVYKPGGILGFAAEFGVFNEPENMVDYTLAVGVSRFGYSHSDGDVSVSAWDIYIKATVLEVNKNVLAYALASVTETQHTVGQTATPIDGYTDIQGNNDIEVTDYLNNITWIGKISGEDDPVIIQVFNALNTDGLTLTVADKNEATIAMTFYGHYDTTELDKAPFKIWIP